MDVYFLPVGPDRYELYCDEAGDPEELAGGEQPTGRFAALYERFKATLAEAEERRLGAEDRPVDHHRSWMERLKDRLFAWLAERIAEQRLLWRLRNVSEVTLHVPDDLSSDAALARAHQELQREADRHLKWLVIDGTLLVASGAFFFVPGPNVLAYYFGFRAVGHYLSRRGARHALSEVVWHCRPSADLSRLRQAMSLDGAARDAEVHQVATALHLPHLARFFERVSPKTA